MLLAQPGCYPNSNARALQCPGTPMPGDYNARGIECKTLQCSDVPNFTICEAQSFNFPCISMPGYINVQALGWPNISVGDDKHGIFGNVINYTFGVEEQFRGKFAVMFYFG